MKTAVIVTLAGVLVCAGCGGGAATVSTPTIQPAEVYHLSGFQPVGPVTPGKPVTITFTVVQPNGQPLVHYRTGPGPHVGIHLLIVRHDLAAIIHRHPPIAKNGLIRQTVVFPSPGPWHLVADIYPAHKGPGYVNFQLFHPIVVSGSYHPQPLPPFDATVTAGGATFHMLGGRPTLHAFQASILTVHVTYQGKPLVFKPWYGALAHAIFFRKDNLAYFHTHICAPNQSACTSTIAGTPTGTSTTPGVLHVGVLLPETGTWRLFLQCLVNGRITTAPFTLRALSPT